MSLFSKVFWIDRVTDLKQMSLQVLTCSKVVPPTPFVTLEEIQTQVFYSSSLSIAYTAIEQSCV